MFVKKHLLVKDLENIWDDSLKFQTFKCSTIKGNLTVQPVSKEPGFGVLFQEVGKFEKFHLQDQILLIEI